MFALMRNDQRRADDEHRSRRRRLQESGLQPLSCPQPPAVYPPVSQRSTNITVTLCPFIQTLVPFTHSSGLYSSSTQTSLSRCVLSSKHSCPSHTPQVSTAAHITCHALNYSLQHQWLCDVRENLTFYICLLECVKCLNNSCSTTIKHLQRD